MLSVMNGVTLPLDKEQFASEAVAAGRYRDTADVVRAGVKLLQRAVAEAAEFVTSLQTARDEADRDGWVNLDEMLAEMDQIGRSSDCAVPRCSASSNGLIKLSHRAGRQSASPTSRDPQWTAHVLQSQKCLPNECTDAHAFGLAKVRTFVRSDPVFVGAERIPKCSDAAPTHHRMRA